MYHFVNGNLIFCTHYWNNSTGFWKDCPRSLKMFWQFFCKEGFSWIRQAGFYKINWWWLVKYFFLFIRFFIKKFSVYILLKWIIIIIATNHWFCGVKILLIIFYHLLLCTHKKTRRWSEKMSPLRGPHKSILGVI